MNGLPPFVTWPDKLRTRLLDETDHLVRTQEFFDDTYPTVNLVYEGDTYSYAQSVSRAFVVFAFLRALSSAAKE